MILDPSGAHLELSAELLKHSPFSDFRIPGVILFSILGIFNLVAAVAVIARWRLYSMASVCQGILLIGWIAVQMWMLREVNALQLIFAGTGVLLVVLGAIGEKEERA